ncbi:MAG: EipA family protein [Pseudomonadota bacterium]
MFQKFMSFALAASAALVMSGCVSPSNSSASSEAAPEQTPSMERARDGSFTESEVVGAVEDWLGVSAETAGRIVKQVFADLGTPNAYVYGEEASAAIGPGLRYGRGTLLMNDNSTQAVYWQGPSIGWDLGANASKTFTLVYNLPTPDTIYQRFPGVEGTAYLVGGVGVNYQRAEGVTLVPMRAGVGARLGANVGYLAYSRDARLWPF